MRVLQVATADGTTRTPAVDRRTVGAVIAVSTSPQVASWGFVPPILQVPRLTGVQYVDCITGDERYGRESELAGGPRMTLSRELRVSPISKVQRDALELTRRVLSQTEAK